MVGWHHQLHGHEFEQTPGAGDGQGGLASCSPWGCKESDMTYQLNNFFKDHLQGISRLSSGEDSALSLQGSQVQSLVGELRA